MNSVEGSMRNRTLRIRSIQNKHTFIKNDIAKSSYEEVLTGYAAKKCWKTMIDVEQWFDINAV